MDAKNTIKRFGQKSDLNRNNVRVIVDGMWTLGAASSILIAIVLGNATGHAFVKAAAGAALW